MPQQIQERRGTAAQWTAVNPVLALGEPGYETDTRKTKHGDGVTAWNSLQYDAGGSVVTVDSDGTLTVDGTAYEAALDSETVHRTGDETIGGNKTFSAPPVVPAPTAAGHATTKAYVDAATPLLRASDGSPATGKRLVVTLTADGTDIADLTIEGA